ncbi:MAG: DNA alkylation repair protein, partial [Prevotella sp.]|nr:DNA alkylation repair protein [Prevotella sp.]
TLMMPPKEMSRELVDIWMEQTFSQEIAEMAVFNLYQYLDYSPMLAFEWIASESAIRQLSGYQLLACLFKRKIEPNDRGINEFLDQAQAALKGGDLSVGHAAMNCLNHFCNLGEEYALIARKALPEYL